MLLRGLLEKHLVKVTYGNWCYFRKMISSKPE